MKIVPSNTLNNLIQNISLNKDINLFVLPRHGIAEILLKFALNINQSFIYSCRSNLQNM